MKKIEIIIQPFKLEDVKDALNDLNIRGMTVSEVKGYGTQKGHKEQYRGSLKVIEFVPKIRIVLVVKNSDEDRVLKAIEDAAKTGNIGDGKIFVTDVSKVIRIRTGELDESAIWDK